MLTEILAQKDNNIVVELSVPRSTYDELKSQSDASKCTVTEIIRRKLLHFGSVDSTKPIVLNDAARQHLERLLARNFTTADEVVSAVQRALQVRVDNIEVPLSPYLLDRLQTRCIGVERETFIKSTIKRLLEEFAGIR